MTFIDLGKSENLFDLGSRGIGGVINGMVGSIIVLLHLYWAVGLITSQVGSVMGWLVQYWTEIFLSHLAGWFITGLGNSLLDRWVITGLLGSHLVWWVHHWACVLG